MRPVILSHILFLLETEAEELEKLRREGVIRASIAKATSLSFEIAMEPAAATHMRRLPPRLAKLERMTADTRVLTETQIQEKLQRAERRRKRRRSKQIAAIVERADGRCITKLGTCLERPAEEDACVISSSTNENVML